MDHGYDAGRKEHPWQKANLFSKFFFLYTRGIFWRTYTTNKLEENDLYDVPIKYRSQKLGNDLEESIEHDLEQHKILSIYRILWSCYGREYLTIGLVQLIVRLFIVATIPMTLSKLVLYFQPHQREVTKEEACIFAVSLILLNLFNIIYTHNYMLTVATLGIKVKTAFCSVMYRKSLKLTPNSLSEMTVGKIVTLMTKDATAFEKIILYANDIWIGFVQAGLVCYLMYCRMGIAAFAGVGFLLVVIPFQIFIGKKASKLRLKTAAKTDERIQATHETISAIKLIKMYVWETFFCKKILNARRKEVGIIVKIFLTKVIILLTGGMTSKIAFYFLITTYVWLGNNISAELVYFTLTLFQRLRHALSVVVPLGIAEFAELHASATRIQTLLEVKNLSETRDEPPVSSPKVYLKGVTVVLKEKEVLKNVTMLLERGLTLVTGPLGSGKSALLRTIMRDCKFREGVVRVDGRISYASQEPWVFPSTVKQNIIFGQKHDQSRYERVLSACALNSDLDFFGEGDELIIGEKGINLSKGQKARISLARAIYKDCEIYLLDDCLAALDTHVKQHVFQECIRKFLKDKLCIVATSSLENVRYGDNVLVLENGALKSLTKAARSSVENIVKDQKQTRNDSKEKESEAGNDDSNETTKLLEKKSRTKNIYAEHKKAGKVGMEVYDKYISYGGGYIVLFIVVVSFIMTQFSKSYTEKIVSNWVDIEENITYLKERNLTSTNEYEGLMKEYSFILAAFSSLIFATTFLYMITSYLFFNFTRRSSNRLHQIMVETILNAPMRFFDRNLIGNVLNRFSNDLAIIDEHFPFDLYEFLEIFLALGGIAIILGMVNFGFLLPVAIVLSVLLIVRSWYMPTGRNLQRLESATRSPMVGYMNSSFEGLTTIRAFHVQPLLTEEFDKHQDLYTATSITNRCCARAFGLALDVCCTLFIAAIVGYFLFAEHASSVGDIGLALTQAFMVSGLVQYGIRKWADIENKLTSVERVLEYTRNEKETKSGSKPTNWPREGRIQFEDVSFSYPDSGKYVFEHLRFSVEANEKIGIAGRTGAGKTSIISSLFRLYQYEGAITIDDVDIATIDLELLRRSIAIIPQDPVLFTGTIRDNIDPLRQRENLDVWSAIKAVKLDRVVLSLDALVTDGGSSFSSGQRQLLCLARAVISRNKIIVMDEATSSMDEETDISIREVLEEHFVSCTVLTVAHKLQSILKCDRVMIVEDGGIVEYDKPSVLLANKNGRFFGMVQEAGRFF